MAETRDEDRRDSVTTLGCRVKSGWAMVVLLAGPAGSPRVLDRRRLELSDPAVPASVQPYHAGVGTAQTDAAEIARLTRIVARRADESMAALVRDHRDQGHRPDRIGIVVGSTADPETIANPHIRAHAEEGRLFRTAVEAAAERHGIRAVVLRERDLYAAAARALGRTPPEIKREATALGRPLGGPWRAEEKAAAVAAWLLLARPLSGRGAEGSRRGS